MQDQNDDQPVPVKPDLKHDSMEYSAATDGDDILDTDNQTAQEAEEEEITNEELALLEEDAPDVQADALNTAETDSQADEDNFLQDTSVDETYDSEDEAESDDEFERK